MPRGAKRNAMLAILGEISNGKVSRTVINNMKDRKRLSEGILDDRCLTDIKNN